MKRAFLIFALLLVISGKGQKDGLGRALKWNAFSVNLGMNSIQTNAFSQATFAGLAPKDTSLQKDFSTFRQRSLSHPNSFHFNIYGTFIPKTKTGNYNSRIEYRFGLIYQNHIRQELEFNKSDSTRLDTFSSASTGMTVYKDSVTEHNYHFLYKGQKIGLDYSQIFQVNKHSVFQIYIGYNLCLFYSYDNYIFSGYSDGRLRRGWFGKNRRYSHLQTSHLQNNYILCASVPVGFTMRLHKKKKATAYRPAFNAEARFGITEDKPGQNYLSPKPWFVLSAGIKLYRNRIYHYKD